MHINGSLPTHIARAYGVSPSKAAQPNAAPEPSEQPAAASTPNPIRSLLAGRVDGPVNFDAPAAARQSSDPVLPMYTRAADKVEAAVAVQIGRTIDVKG